MNLPFAINMKYNCRQIFLLWFFTTSILLSAKAIDIPPDKAPLLFVNGYAVSIEEFRWFMQQERAGVFQYVKTRYNLDYGKGFWDHDCGQTTPRAIILKQTTDRIVREKIEQILFVQLGLVKDVNYVTFLRDLERLNIQRTAAINRGQVIYGPVNYTQLQYYGHWKATLQIQSKEKLSTSHFDVDDKKVKKFYDKNKSKFFRAVPTISLAIMRIEAGNKSMTAIEALGQEIRSKINSSHDCEKIKTAYAHDTDIKISCDQFGDLSYDKINEMFSNDEQAKIVKGMVPGRNILLPLNKHAVQIITCTARRSEKFQPYKSIKEKVKTLFIDQQYNRLLDDMVAKANVVIDNNAISAILMFGAE